MSVHTVALGEPGDGAPSQPVALGNGIVVAFTRTDASGSKLLVQRVGWDGIAEPARVIEQGVHGSRPQLVGDGSRAYVIVISANGDSEAVGLDPATGSPVGTDHHPLAYPPDGVAVGKGGLVTTFADGGYRIVRTPGAPDVKVSESTSFGEPREQIVATGTSRTVVLTRQQRAARLVFNDKGTPHPSAVLFQDMPGVWTEASVASNPAGFLLVRTGPKIGDLEVYLADAVGTLAAPIAIPPPTASDQPPDALVRRYPRATSVGKGWALSYWDGTGVSLVRIDEAGRVVGDAVALRNGDERGGHTDARMVAGDDAVAVTWNVAPPRMHHGFPEEDPSRPGPQLGIARCVR